MNKSTASAFIIYSGGKSIHAWVNQPMKTITINDGPDYAPNKKRNVQIIRESDVPGMILCKDVDTGETVTVERGKLERGEVKL